MEWKGEHGMTVHWVHGSHVNNGAMTYVTWHGGEEAAIQSDHAVMLAWIWFSWFKMMGFVTFFCVRGGICWSRDNTAKVSDVQKSISCSLDDYCDSMQRVSRLLSALDFCCQVSEINRNWGWFIFRFGYFWQQNPLVAHKHEDVCHEAQTYPSK